MAKNKTKKNHILRRRVMRTIAAITMVMAVVVASIPVENFGTMQAAEDDIALLALDSNFNMKDIYNDYVSNDLKPKYDNDYFSDGLENGYDNNEADWVNIQQVDDNANVTDAYRAALGGNRAIVSGIGDINNITINETEYYNYVMFDITNESLDRDLGIAEIALTFGAETNRVSHTFDTGKNKYALDSNPTQELSLGNISGIRKFTDTYTGSISGIPEHVQNSNVTDNSQGYDNRLAANINGDDFIDLIENCEVDAINTYINGTLKEYNDRVDSLQAIYDKVSVGPTTTTETTTGEDGSEITTTKTTYPTLTQSEVDLWEEFASSTADELFDDIETLTIDQDAFSVDSNGLKSIYHYIICQYYGINSGSLNLKNFELVKGSYKNSQVYLPRLKSGLFSASGQYTERGGYLATNTTDIAGIRHEAFKDTLVESVVTPISVTFIGAGAFDGCQNLKSVTIDTDGGCTIIGDSAFADSTLNTITFTNTESSGSLSLLGVNAFKNTKLKSIIIPASVTRLEAACFAGSLSLDTVVFMAGGNNDVAIEEYAFYNCAALSAVTFEDEEKEYEIAKGAFALERDLDRGTGFTFKFPEGNTTIDYNKNSQGYDYILAGRANMESVVFTSKIRGVIPPNTLRGCYNLGGAVFETASASYDSYDKVNNKPFDTQLFSDVRNDQFMVEGPAVDVAGETAAPRKSSWTGILGYIVDGEWAPVPYKFTDEDGEHIELGYRGGQYVAKIDVVDNNTAILSSYTVNGNVQTLDERIPVTIPNEVGNYHIIAIGEDCFQGEVKEKIYKITIEDGYITTIGARAFEECENLEWVYIGSPVTLIGEEAFAGCQRLENVVFSQIGKGIEYLGDEDEYWEENLSIGEDAFATKSEHLTFYGAIHSGYAPFELAMSAVSKDMTSTGAHICYKSGEPKNLTVLRNEKNGKATLVDYPHYDEIDLINNEYIKEVYGRDYSILEAFEDNYFNEVDNGFKEIAIIEGALRVNLPRGIESIDSVSFFGKTGTEIENQNTQDHFYLKNRYVFTESNLRGTSKLYVPTELISGIRDNANHDITKIYSENKYIADSDYAAAYEDEDVAIGGLFSGYFDEDGIAISRAIYETYAEEDDRRGMIGKSYEGHEYTEDFNSGNDYLSNITMPTVEILPSYAFDSCENLMTAGFGKELQTIGVLPFRNCKSMYNVDFGENTKYAFHNLLLYENIGDDTNKEYQIIEMLESRGKGGDYLADSIVAEEILENVTSISPSAFANNTNIRNIDLSATRVIEIPTDCFKNDINLNKLVLPTTIRQLDTGSLINVCDGIELIIPTGDCVITADAVDGTKNVFITGVKYMEDGSLSNLWHSYDTLAKSYNKDPNNPKIHFNDYGSTYHIEFVDKDMRTISTFPIEIRENQAYNLEARDIPEAPAEDGLEFQYWMCKVGNNVYQGTEVGDAAFVNIKEDRLYYPYYVSNPDNIVSEGDFKFEFENCEAMLGATPLTSGDSVSGGAAIVLRVSDESKFSYWSVVGTAEGDNANYTGNFQSSVTQPMTTFRMPNADVKVTANLTGTGGDTPGGNNPGGNTPGGNNPGGSDDGTKYKLTVNYGSGSGEYAAGTTVSISAFAPDSSNRVFNRWSSSNASVGFASATSATTTLVMPESDLTVTANYKTRVGDDDDDDDDDDNRRPGRPGTSTSTTTVSTTPNASTTTTTGTTGTVTDNTTGTTDSNGNKIYITKNGISNKDVASISVDGSTDNFIVRITESAEATAAAEESLINRYETLDGIVYFPMDISLYDSTGQHKITDTYGLNITVTMPIPDVLIQYGGNARVAACDNGNLQQITPRFTTIDGIACISFVPPHFSPYVIYVDTNNLIAGQMLDQTPSTGDPIHPKWFLAIGMACLSIILFATSDGRRKKSIKAA